LIEFTKNAASTRYVIFVNQNCSGPLRRRGALASAFRPEQHVAQSAQWCGRTRGWQSRIRYLSGRSVVWRLCTPVPLWAELPQRPVLDGGSAASLYAPSLNRYGNILSLVAWSDACCMRERRSSAV